MAVSIPIFTAQLRKARVATDLANERAAKAAAVAQVLTDETKMSNAGANTYTYWYNAKEGTVVAVADSNKPTGYGKTSNVTNGDGFAATCVGNTHVDKAVKVTITTNTTDASASVTMAWE